VTVTTTNGTSATESSAGFVYSGPSVSSVMPPGGSPSGGTRVDIAGGGFTGATAVQFGATPASSFDVVSDSLVTAVSPPGVNGATVDVTVTTPAGTSPHFSPDHFLYTHLPVIGSVTPGSGTVRGGTRVTISGANLGSATSVLFGGVGSRFSVAGPSSIVVSTPPSPSGARLVGVTVTNGFGSSGQSALAEFRYLLAPTGYWMAAADGGIFAFGAANFAGSMGGKRLNAPVVGMAATTDDAGYWMVASDGGVFSFGNANYAGSMGAKRLNAPVVGMAATTDDGGYWMVASDGGVFSFGDARFAGSMGGRHLNAPVVGIAATADDGGYWLVASDGGVFSFGDARFAGSMGGTHLNAPVVGVAAGAGDSSYWMVASDGGVFSFGDARFAGSMGGTRLNAPIVGIASVSSYTGYLLIGSDGGVFAFSAQYSGSAADLRLVAKMVGIAST
jgi:hypothetical protein